jgi:hypothetical protein
MALIKLNINNFKKNAGGIANRLVDNVVNKLEQKLENAVEDAFAKGLKKIGLSDNIAGELSARFGDAFSAGQADRFFGTSTAEQNRVSSKDCVDNILNRGAETVVDAQESIFSKVQQEEGLLAFPPDYGEYYMLMNFTEYSRPSPQTVATRKGLKKFILPIPRELKEQFSNNIDPKGMGVLAGGLADVGTNVFRGATEGTGKQLEAIGYSYAVQRVGDLLQGADDAIGQFGGAVPNPHLQAIFNGVQMRTHSFQWTFSPRNAVESRQLQQIIYELKKYSLPAFSNLGTAALQYAPLVDIELYPWMKDGDQYQLIRFKPCLVQNISINYSPQGLPSFFKGTRQPTFIQISIDFMETEIQTAYDYGNKSGERTDQASRLLDEIKGAAANTLPAELVDAITEAGNYGNKLLQIAADAAKRANQ